MVGKFYVIKTDTEGYNHLNNLIVEVMSVEDDQVCTVRVVKNRKFKIQSKAKYRNGANRSDYTLEYDKDFLNDFEFRFDKKSLVKLKGSDLW